jgi:predicted GTPase
LPCFSFLFFQPYAPDQVNKSGRGTAGVPLLGLSALHGGGVSTLLPAVWDTYLKWNRQVSTGRLNRWLVRAKTAATGGANVLNRIRFIMQVRGWAFYPVH